MTEDVKLTVRESALDDWWVIERAEHDGRAWLDRRDGYSALMLSARISDADVEGTAEEMHGIADAIEKRGSFHAKRCAVSWLNGAFEFWSPRNSQKPGRVTAARADELAAEIRWKVPALAGEGERNG